jgi:hypothetical protein
MNDTDRPDHRQSSSAARRMQLEQVRATVRAQLAEIHRRRQELSARRRPVRPKPEMPPQGRG